MGPPCARDGPTARAPGVGGLGHRGSPSAAGPRRPGAGRSARAVDVLVGRDRVGDRRLPGGGTWAAGSTVCTWASRWFTDGRDPVEERPRVDPEEHDPGQQGRHRPDLPPGDVPDARRWPHPDGSVEHPLVRPQHVDGPRDDGGGGDDRPPRWVMKVPTRTRNSPTKPLSPAADRAHDHGQEDGGQDRGRLLQAAQVADPQGAAPLPDDADQEEDGPGGQAVVDHLQHAPGDPLGAEGEDARAR